MDNKQKQTEPMMVSLSDIFGGKLGNVKPSNYQVDSLHELLCSRYNLSRHTKKEKLIDLVVKELNI